MAYPGSTTYPGTTTWPGVPYVDPSPGPEGDIPEPRTGPIGQPPTEALLVVFTPPTGVGAPVVRECPADLQFGSTAPGGFEALTCTIDWPDGWPPPDGLATASIAQVVDRRNGEVIWHGHVVDPGYTRTGTGASHHIAAQGFSTVLDTQAGALAYVDRDLGSWLYAKDYPAGSAQMVDDLSLPQHPSDWVDQTTSVIQQDISKGSALDASTPTHATMQYLPAKYGATHQDIICILGTFDCTNSADFRIKVRVVTQAGTVDTVMDRAYTSLSKDFRLFEGDGTWDITNARVAQLRWEYGGASDAAASRDYFVRWGNLAVVFRRNNRAGDPVTDPSTSVKCSDLVDDVIGRMLADDLLISADIAAPDTLVEHAVWWEGITARGVFDFVARLEPDFYWAVWEPQVIGGKARFEYVTWRTYPRYVIPPDSATINLVGGADDLADVALVSYQTSNGVPASTVVRASVPELTAAGVSRTLMVDLTGEGTLSAASAAAKGLHALRTANLQRSSGSATVFGPVLDMRTGRMVEPWEIRAGWNVVLGGGQLRADGGLAYSTTGSRDGRSTFRATAVTYSASSQTAEITLDGGRRSLFNRVRRPLPRIGYRGHRNLIKSLG